MLAVHSQSCMLELVEDSRQHCVTVRLIWGGGGGGSDMELMTICRLQCCIPYLVVIIKFSCIPSKIFAFYQLKI